MEQLLMTMLLLVLVLVLAIDAASSSDSVSSGGVSSAKASVVSSSGRSGGVTSSITTAASSQSSEPTTSKGSGSTTSQPSMLVSSGASTSATTGSSSSDSLLSDSTSNSQFSTTTGESGSSKQPSLPPIPPSSPGMSSTTSSVNSVVALSTTVPGSTRDQSGSSGQVGAVSATSLGSGSHATSGQSSSLVPTSTVRSTSTSAVGSAARASSSSSSVESVGDGSSSHLNRQSSSGFSGGGGDSTTSTPPRVTTSSSSNSSGNSTNSTETTEPPAPQSFFAGLKHLLPVDTSALMSLSSVAAVMTLASAIVNPALCAQTARIYLILQLSQCSFASLEDIEVIFYPLQFTIGGDPAAKFFTSMIFVWPFSAFVILVHFLIVKVQAGKDREKLELLKRKYHFPSLSITALVVFFWQPMTMSSVTVLSRGKDQWMRFFCFIGLLIAFILFSFAVRWSKEKMKNIEFLDAKAFYQRLIEDAEDAAKKVEKDEADEKEKKEKEEEEEKTEEKAAGASLADVKKSLKAKRQRAKEAREARAAKRKEGVGKAEGDDSLIVSTRTHEVYIPLSSTEASDQNTLLEKLFTAPGRWVDFKTPDDPDGKLYHSPGFVEKHGYMFIKYRPGRQWFLGTEIIVSTILGILEGVRPMSRRGCWLLSVIQFSTLMLLMIFSLVMRPYLTLFDTISFSFLSFTQALAVLFLMLDVQDFLDNPKGFLLGSNPFVDDSASSSGSDFGNSSTSTSFSAITSRPGTTGMVSSSVEATPAPILTTGIRQASDIIAFGLFAVILLKAVIDIGVMIYFWKKHQKSDKKDEEGDSEDDKKKKTKKGGKKGAKEEETGDGEEEEEKKPATKGKKAVAAKKGSSKSGAQSDSEEGGAHDEKRVMPKGKGVVGGKKSNPLAKPLLDDVPALSSKKAEDKPKKAEEKSKSGSGNSARKKKGADTEAKDVGDNLLASSPLSKKKRGSAARRGGDDDGGEVEMKEESPKKAKGKKK